MRAVFDGEEIGFCADAFRSAEDQKSGGRQGEMEEGEHSILQDRLKIDEEVAATDQVHLGERGIVEEIVLAKMHMSRIVLLTR